MLHAMLDDDPRFAVDPVEIERKGLSYTVETLQGYAERDPAAERYFFVGADALGSLQSWREPARILALARLAVLARTSGAATVTDEWIGDALRALERPDTQAPVILATRRVDISSTEIRARVAAGKPVRGFVVDAVARYIEASGLYR